jgi:hypothetical protein
MSDWLHSLPVLWMAILVFGFTYLVTAGIYAVITVFAVGERARHLRPSLLGCCRPWVSSSAFSLCSPPPRFGQTTKRLGRKSIEPATDAA